MNYLHFFIFGIIFILVGGVFSDETNMLEMVYKECNLTKIYNNSQIDTLKNEPEFKNCQNWTAITSIKSSKQFTENNMNTIKCLLYYESIVPICKNESVLEKLYDLIVATPENAYTEDFCKNLLTVLPASETIHSLLKNSLQCEHLCTEFQNGEPIVNQMCIKSYNFNKFLLEVKQSQNSLASIASTINESTIKTVPKVNDVGTDKKQNQSITVVSQNLVELGDSVDPAQKHGNQENILPQSGDVKPDTVVGGNVASGQKSNQSGSLPEKQDDKVVAYINPSPAKPDVAIDGKVVPVQGRGNQDIVNPDKTQKNISDPAANELAPPNKNYLTNSGTKSSTVANDQLSQVQNIQEKLKPDLDTDMIDTEIDQQVPPKLDDPNTAPGEYDFEPEKTEQINEPKKGDTLEEVAPDEALPDSYKMPKVSQLSDRFGYDADVNGNSNFFTYFSFTCVIFVIGYVVYHNKTKVLALLVEGRHTRRTQRVRRPNIANYQKLDSNLEEAISSSVSKNPSHVIY